MKGNQAVQWMAVTVRMAWLRLFDPAAVEEGLARVMLKPGLLDKHPMVARMNSPFLRKR